MTGRPLQHLLTVAAGLTITVMTCHAADGTWVDQSGGDWNSPAKWDLNSIAQGPGAKATIEANWTSALSVNLDSATTIGHLSYRDNGTVNRDMFLESSAAHTLTLDGGGIQSPPTIEARNRSIAIRVRLAGTQGVLFRCSQGNRVISLNKIASYSSGTRIASGSGTVAILTGGQLGSGTITLEDDSDASDTDLRFDHSGAAPPLTPLVLEPNTRLELNFAGDSILLSSLSIAGSNLGPGTYDATSHPAALSGTGSLTVPSTGNGNWINVTDTDVSWADPLMWENQTIANGTNAIADFHNGGQDHLVSKNVDISFDITLGQVIYRDSGNPNRNLTIKSSNASGLIMDTTSGTPLLWARNRSINIDVPIYGDDGLQLKSEQSTQAGVTLQRRNHYTGLTTIIDSTGPSTILYPGDFGNSDVRVLGDLSDAASELVLGHSLAIKESASLTIDTGASIDLNFPNLLPGQADASDLYVRELILAGASQAPGIYDNSTHPTFFEGTGQIIVQIPRDEFHQSIASMPGDEARLTWPSLYGRVYDIMESETLDSESWTTLGTVDTTPPTNQADVSLPEMDAAFYRIKERTDDLASARAGVIARIDGFISNNYLVDQNTDPTDIRFGQFHNSDNMRQSECTPVLVWAYLQPDSQHYQNAAALESAIRSLDYMVRAQGINGGFNEYHGWCGVPNRTNGKSSVTGFTLHCLGAAIEMLADLPEMQPRLLENIDANGTGNLDTERLSAWKSMLSQAMPFQFSGSGRGHAPNQDLCALMAVYKINDAYAALTGGTLLKTTAQITTLSNEIFHGQPSAASSRPNGKWFSDTGMLGEGGYGFYGYDGNYGTIVTMNYLGLLADRDPVAETFLTTKYAESIQYFFVPDDAARLGVFAENGISRRSTGDPLNTGILPFALTHEYHPSGARLYDIALPYFAAAPVANMPFSSPSHFQVGVWMYCEWIEKLQAAPATNYLLPAEQPGAWTFTDTTYKTLISKPAGGEVTYYAEDWDGQARRHTWNEAAETIPSLGLFP